MSYTNVYYGWILDSLFILGFLLIPVGIGFLLTPVKMFELANKMNRWIATDSFFNKINLPIYKERFFYRHNKVFGMVIILSSIACLYVLAINSGVEYIVEILIQFAETAFEEWLFVILYYLLIAGIILALIFGVIMFIRPSALKSFEKWSNQWIDTDEPLEVMNKTQDVPDKILPGKPRIFGLLVLIAAMYIIWSVSTAI